MMRRKAAPQSRLSTCTGIKRENFCLYTPAATQARPIRGDTSGESAAVYCAYTSGGLHEYRRRTTRTFGHTHHHKTVPYSNELLFGGAGNERAGAVVAVRCHRTPGTVLGGESILALASATWLVLITAFAVKLITRRDALRSELRDLVMCCFLALVPVTTIEVGISARPYAAPLGYSLILIGVLGQLAFSMYRTAGLWRGTHTVAATTPVIYLPTVAANFASASGLGALGHRDWAMLFFGMGLLSWFSVEAAILGRLRTEPALDPAVRGIIGVQLAPPFVGGNAYLAANGGHVDWVFLVLTGYGVLQLLFLLRLVPWVLKAGYTMSLWGFSFGLGAMAGTGMHLVAVSQLVQLGWALWILGTALIAVLWLGMLVLAIRGKLLVR